MGIFADNVPLYVERGFRVIPTGKKDGKKPLIGNWQNVGKKAATELAKQFPDANIAVIDGDKVTRIDVDDPELMDGAIQRFGNTPVKVQTPSGGYHLWYAANGERRKVRIDGLKIDVLGKGGYGVAPPSVCPGKGEYRFIEGSLEDTERLPVIRIGSLPMAESYQDELTEEEAAKRRDEALKRALNTPPKPRKTRQNERVKKTPKS